MAMLQQQSAPDAGTHEQQQNGTAPQQTSPPVTSQTPATPTGAANGSTTGQAPAASPGNNAGMTGSEANHDAQAARQGELNTNPNTGDTSGRGVNNQGANYSVDDQPERGCGFAEFSHVAEQRRRREQAALRAPGHRHSLGEPGQWKLRHVEPFSLNPQTYSE